MLIDAKIIHDKEGGPPNWVIDIPLIDTVTQGYTKKEAVEMSVSLVEELLDIYFGDGSGKKAKVSTSGVKKDSFFIEAEDQNKLVSLILIKQREKYGVTFSELQKRLNAKSTYSYKRYETGKHNITVGKFYELMNAVSPDNKLVFKLAN